MYRMDYIYVKPDVFVRPQAPAYNRGYLVIESDDGYARQYTHWYHIFKQKSQKYYSQWANDNTVIGCSAINSTSIGATNMLTIAEILEMQDYGCEMISHGRYHTGLGVYLVTSQAAAGQKRIDVNVGNEIRTKAGYAYTITDGVNSESIVPVTINIDHILVKDNLQHTYGIDSTIQLTDESAEDLLQGCIDDLTALGVKVQNHVYAYHSGSGIRYSEKALEWVGQYFISGRGQYGLVDPKTADLRNLKCYSEDIVEKEDIDTYLDEVALNNWLMIYYGHSGTSSVSLGKLKYLIDGALSRGIRITTRIKALKALNLV